MVDPDQTGADGFVLPQSATHIYTREELSGLSAWGLAVARNEMPARHGYIFDKAEFKQYFESKNWYRGTLTGDEFQRIVGILNYVEEQNVQTILELEREKGSSYTPGGSDAVVVNPDNTGPDGYVLPQSASHRYTRKELSGLSDWGLAVARNEISARHGYIFSMPEFRQYFESKNWYKGTLTRDEFRSIAGILNKTEEANIDTILAMERKRGSKYVPKG